MDDVTSYPDLKVEKVDYLTEVSYKKTLVVVKADQNSPLKYIQISYDSVSSYSRAVICLFILI